MDTVIDKASIMAALDVVVVKLLEAMYCPAEDKRREALMHALDKVIEAAQYVSPRGAEVYKMYVNHTIAEAESES